MARARVHDIAVSLDGFATGEPQTLQSPFGHAGQRLHQWMFATPTFQGTHFDTGVQPGPALDDEYVQRNLDGIGAEIMGSHKFGPPDWHLDPEWRGWWGEEPPFHSPVYVLTHHPRPPLVMGETTFHFIDASPREALELASADAGGLDVRIGGGPTTVREFLDADLVDHMHVVVVPILLGRGVRLWDGQEGLEARYDIRSEASPSGVTHLTFERKRELP